MIRPWPPPARDEAWHRDEIVSQQDGSAVVYSSTNDDDDDGIPDQQGVVEWQTRWPTVERALTHYGRSRVGISGIRVTVILDGIELR